MSQDFRDAPTEYTPPPTPKGGGEETVDLGPGGLPKTIGAYEVLGVLGQGGMGAVYRARDPSLEREVALKVLPPDVANDDEQTERFLREAKVAARISSPHVITVHAVGEHEGRPFMALELVRGGDADQLTKRSPGKRLTERRALELTRDCARGLVAIERAGLVHRDIKPSNVFLTEDGMAKLADLGLARSRSGEDQLTQTGTIVGTPAYMAPEQARGERVDIRTDIYALGATLFGLVTGRAPFQGTSVFVIVANVLNEPMPDPQNVRDDLSDATADLIRRACAKAAADRFQTAQELLEAVEAAFEAAPRGRRISARRGSSRANAPTVVEPAPPAERAAQTERARPSPRSNAEDAPLVGRYGGAPLPPDLREPRVPSRRMLLLGIPAAGLASCCLLAAVAGDRKRAAQPDPALTEVADADPAPTGAPAATPDPDPQDEAETGIARWLRWETTQPERVLRVADPDRIAFEPRPGKHQVVFTDRRQTPWPLPSGAAGPGQPGGFTSFRAVWTVRRVQVQRPPGFTVVAGLRARNTPIRGDGDLGPALGVELRFGRFPPGIGKPMVGGRIVGGLIRRTLGRRRRRLHPPTSDATLEPQPYDPSRPLVIVLDVNRIGWSVYVGHGTTERGTQRTWAECPPARARALQRGVYLFAALANEGEGHGRGALSLQVIPEHQGK